MENNKKILIPTIVAVATLVLLVFGATYAYFTVGSTNNFGTKELNATLEDMADAVVLEQVESTLSLNVTRAMMSEDNSGTTYYASGSSTPANIAKISTSGEGMYACTYTIKVTKSASSAENDLYTAIQGMSQMYGNASLILNGKHYDFLSTNLFPITHIGTIHGITEDTPQYITANMLIKNSIANQNELKGKDITLTFEVTEFNCYLDEYSVPIYAIYEEAYPGDDHREGTLAFYQNNDEVNVGDTYDGYTVTEVYKNLNNTNYKNASEVPWNSLISSESNLIALTFEDVISPESTAYWFANSMLCDYDFGNLDTSRVTDMSHMFESAQCSYNFGVDLSQFDTSNVTDMSYMFYASGPFDFSVNLSSWDTSKVTNMSNMFKYAASDGRFSIDISTWDTSNVTNMESMFECVACNDFDDYDYFYIGDITRKEVTSNGKTYIAWDTSKVVNMGSMFSGAGEYFDYTLNLTSWQVPLVTNHTNFNKGVESKITAPNWVN